MIFIFHSLYFLFKHLQKVYRRSRTVDEFRKLHSFLDSEVSLHNSCLIDAQDKIQFDPPIYKLRYVGAQQVLLHENFRGRLTKVVDFGCAEQKLFQYLKRLYGIQEILCVDADEYVLKDNLFRVHPLTVDYLKRRVDPLVVQVLCGSIGDPDYRLTGTDAVLCVEIIEHLYPDVLEAVPYNIFNFIRPLVAVFTTPNADFNVLFGKIEKFRHADHKFEWSREQFQSWAHNITIRFPDYTVSFEGIGYGPKGSEALGCCSQMAIFVKNALVLEQPCEVPRSCREITTIKEALDETEELVASHGICTYFSYTCQINLYDERLPTDVNTGSTYYKLVEKVEYPYEVDTRTVEEKIKEEILYKIYTCASNTGRFYNDETGKVELPLYELATNEDGCFITTSEVKKLLERENFNIEECKLFGRNQPTLCVVYDPTMDNRSASPGNESSNSDERNEEKEPYQPSDEVDWDAEYNESCCFKSSSELKENETKVVDSKTNSISNLKTSLDALCNASEPNFVSNVEQSEQKLRYSVHSDLTSGAIDAMPSEYETKSINPVQKDADQNPRRSNVKTFPQSKVHIGSKHVPKKGTNVKNPIPSAQGSSRESSLPKPVPKKCPETIAENEVSNKRLLKKTPESKRKNSNHSIAQVESTKKMSKGNKTSVTGSNKHSTKSAKNLLSQSPQKPEESLPGTSEIKKKKSKKPDTDDDKEDIRNLTECIVYNSLNKIQEADELEQQADIPHLEQVFPVEPPVENGDLANNNRDLEGNNYPDGVIEFVERPNEDKENDNVQVEAEEAVRNQDFQNRNKDNEEVDVAQDRAAAELAENRLGQELSHASREALFDPNSEVDMLEEFEFPTATIGPAPGTASYQNRVVVIGVHRNEENSVALPENADPFPNWLLQLLGANVDDGESHDEPHFYCQGDGIGVHPSIIEVEIDEEQSSSGSSGSNDEAEAERTISESGIGSLPNDEVEADNSREHQQLEVVGRLIVPEHIPLPTSSSSGSSSAADSADEFFDTVDETLMLNNTPKKNSQG